MPFEDFVVCDADMHVMEPADLWQRYMTPEYRHAAFLVKGKGPKEQKNEWDLFTVMGSVGGPSVLPPLKSLGY